jgi:hypothetical protein
MALDTLLPNGDDSGWPTGAFTDIDEGIASADAAVMFTTIDDDVLIVDLTATTITDADTVNSVTVKIHGRSTGSGGKDTFTVDFQIGGVDQGGPQVTADLAGSHATYTLTDAAWDSDWTAAQLNGATLKIQATQTGKPTAATWEIDAIDVEVDYTVPPSGHPRAMVHHMKQMAGA